MRRGFTLVEILTVVAIISILTSVAFAGVQNARQRAQDIRAFAQSAELNRRLIANCVSGWTFEEGSGGVSDTCYNNYAGTITGASRVAGIKGEALSFDGDDYVDFGPMNFDADGPLEDGLTISALFKATQWSSGFYDGRIVDKSIDQAEQNNYLMLSTINQGGTARLRFRLKTTNGGTAELIASSGDLSLNKWYFAVGTYDGSTMKIFLDGVEVGSMAKTGQVSTNNSPLYIGNNSVLNRPWYGMIDNVYIYEEAY